MYFNHIKIL